MQVNNSLHMTEVNSHLTCVLCGGYFVDATTIVECLHSFCRTCIVRYMESSKLCPVCDVMVHKKRPLQRIRPDPTLQNLVYKIVPGLFKEEMRRRRAFYEKNKTEDEKCKVSADGTEGTRIIFSPDEKISLSLELCPHGVPVDEDCDELDDNSKLCDRRNLLCPASLTIAHLKKFIRVKYSLSSSYQIDIFHGLESLCDGYTLMDIAYITSWNQKGEIRLHYSIFENLAKRMRLEIPVPLKTHAKLLASTPQTNIGTSTQFLHSPVSTGTRPDHCVTFTTQTMCSQSSTHTSPPVHCPNVSRPELCDTLSETSKSGQYTTSITQRSRLGQCSTTAAQMSRPGQCTTTETQLSRPGQCTTTETQLSRPGQCTTHATQMSRPGQCTTTETQMSRPGQCTTHATQISRPGQCTTTETQMSRPGQCTTTETQMSRPGQFTTHATQMSRPGQCTTTETQMSRPGQRTTAATQMSRLGQCTSTETQMSRLGQCTTTETQMSRPGQCTTPATQMSRLGQCTTTATQMSRPGQRTTPATQMSRLGQCTTNATQMLRPGQCTTTATQMSQPGQCTTTATQMSQPGQCTTTATQMSQPGECTTTATQMSQPGECTTPVTQMSQPGQCTTTATQMSQPGECTTPATQMSRLGQCTTTATQMSQPRECTTPATQMSRLGQCTTPVTQMSQPRECTTTATQMSQPGECTTPVTQMSRPGECTTTATQMSRPGQCTTTATQMSRPGQCSTTATQISRPGQCLTSTTKPAWYGQCTTTILTCESALCATSTSSTLQPIASPCLNDQTPSTVKITCSTDSALIAKETENITESNTETENAASKTDRATLITEIDGAFVCDDHHSIISENGLEREMEEAKMEKQAGISEDNTSCLDSVTDCTEISKCTTNTTEAIPSGVEPFDHSVVQHGDISEAETKEHETVCNSKCEKDHLKEIDFSNVDENRNQKLQNDVHTQTDSNALQGADMLLLSQTVLKQPRVTETAQTQTSFSPESQLSQTISLSREKATGQNSVYAKKSYKQTNSDKINDNSREKDDGVKVVVEEVPSANIPIALENHVKYLDHSEYHCNATVNGFCRDSDENPTATVKQEVMSECATETS